MAKHSRARSPSTSATRPRLGAVPAPEGARRRAERAADLLGRRRLRHDGRLRRAGRSAEHAPDRRHGRALLELPHDGPVLADPRLAAQRPQRDLERDGDDRRVRLGLPRHLDPDPVRERR